MAADILVITSSIWLGEKTSVATQTIERLYSSSGDLNEHGQYAYYGRVGGCLITGNEDGAKHCSMNILYSLQHLGYVIPPQADAAWLGEAGPGPSYLDPRFWRTGERLYESKHDVHDMESDAHGSDDQGRWRDSCAWKSAQGMGRGLSVRLSESRIPLIAQRS